MLNKVSDCKKETPELSPMLSTHPIPVLKSTTIPSDDPILTLVKQKNVHYKTLETIKHVYKLGKSEYMAPKTLERLIKYCNVKQIKKR